MSIDNSISDGLFTVTCECGIVFPAERVTCNACQKTKGILKLDISLFLERLYVLSAHGKKSIDDALDLIFEVFWHLHNKFDIMNEVMGQVEVDKLNNSLIVGFLVQTFKYIPQVPNHLVFCDRAVIALKARGTDDKTIKDLVDNYREVNDYWKTMDMLGAPEWLTGPKP